MLPEEFFMRRKENEPLSMGLIYAKSHWDGDCLVWDGCLSHGRPYMRAPNGKPAPVRRLIVEHIQGKHVGNFLVTHKCECTRCVNPDHLIVGTRSTVNKIHADRTKYGDNLIRNMKIAEALRKNSKTTPEQLDIIRNDPQSTWKVAQQLKISHTFVRDVRNGKLWKDYTSPFAQLMR